MTFDGGGVVMMPDTIKIFGHDFVVKMHKEEDSGNVSLGTYMVGRNTILINTRQSDSQMESTLLHEIIEIVNALNELGLTHSQVSALETGLYAVLKDNRMLVI